MIEIQYNIVEENFAIFFITTTNGITYFSPYESRNNTLRIRDKSYRDHIINYLLMGNIIPSEVREFTIV